MKSQTSIYKSNYIRGGVALSVMALYLSMATALHASDKKVENKLAKDISQGWEQAISNEKSIADLKIVSIRMVKCVSERELYGETSATTKECKEIINVWDEAEMRAMAKRYATVLVMTILSEEKDESLQGLKEVLRQQFQSLGDFSPLNKEKPEIYNTRWNALKAKTNSNILLEFEAQEFKKLQ